MKSTFSSLLLIATACGTSNLINFSQTKTVNIRQSPTKIYTTNRITNNTDNAISSSNILSYHNDTVWITYDMSSLNVGYTGIKPALQIDTSNYGLIINWNKIDYSKLPNHITKDEITQQVNLVINSKNTNTGVQEYENSMKWNTTNYYDDVRGDGNDKLLTFSAIEKPFILTGTGAEKVWNYQKLDFQFGLYYITEAIKAGNITKEQGVILTTEFFTHAFPQNTQAANLKIATNIVKNFIQFDSCYNFLQNIPYESRGNQNFTNYLMLDKDYQIIECGQNIYTYYASQITFDRISEVNIYLNFKDFWHINSYKDCDSYLNNTIGYPAGIGSNDKSEIASLFMLDFNYNTITNCAKNGNIGVIINLDSDTFGDWNLDFINNWN